MQYEVNNAKIEGVFIGIEDHGILTMVARIASRSYCCGVGCRDLRWKGEEADEESFASRNICGLLRVCEQGEIDKCRGVVVRAAWNGNGCAGIGHAINDVWWDGGAKCGPWKEVFHGATATMMT